MTDTVEQIASKAASEIVVSKQMMTHSEMSEIIEAAIERVIEMCAGMASC